MPNKLKYEIRARLELTYSYFYDLNQQQLSVFLFEMIAPVTKAEFLKVLKKTVVFSRLRHTTTYEPPNISVTAVSV